MKRSRAVPQRIGLAACAVAALAIAATGSGSAQAASGRLAGRTSGSTSRDTRVTTSLPAGYRVISASFTGPAGQQAYGQVTCPATSTGVQLYVQGGGVFNLTGSLDVNVNSSWPINGGLGWGAFVNNGTSADVSFTVYGICARPKRLYQLVSQTETNQPGPSTAQVYCPIGAKVLGGGGILLSSSVAANMMNSFPISGGSGAPFGWEVDAYNGTRADYYFSVYAVCSRYSISTGGYQIVQGPQVSAPPGEETFAGVACPSPKVPLGGGVFASWARGVAIPLINGTYPFNFSWNNWVNVPTTGGSDLTPFAVCAGT